jgi:hypothetical protein
MEVIREMLGMTPQTHPYFTEIVYRVVLQQSIPAQICQHTDIKDKLTDLCGNSLWQTVKTLSVR